MPVIAEQLTAPDVAQITSRECDHGQLGDTVLRGSESRTAAMPPRLVVGSSVSIPPIRCATRSRRRVVIHHGHAPTSRCTQVKREFFSQGTALLESAEVAGLPGHRSIPSAASNPRLADSIQQWTTPSLWSDPHIERKRNENGALTSPELSVGDDDGLAVLNGA